jgi:7-cyano-7-deazaguanine synthase
LLSGGLDSSAALYARGDWATRALFVDYGQISAAGELRAARRVAARLGVELDVATAPGLARLGAGRLSGDGAAREADGDTELQRDEWFPARNLVLIAIAGMLVGRDQIGELCLGASDQTYRDCRPAFYSAAESALGESLPGEPAVRVTVSERPRVDVLREAIIAGLDVRTTFSCNRRADRHCWRCTSCRDRANIFKELGVWA